LIVDIDTFQDWEEGPITGRNQGILVLSHLLMYVAWRLLLPHEILLLAKSSVVNSTPDMLGDDG